MSLREMYVEIPRIRSEFKEALVKTGGDVKSSVKGAFKNCCSSFEEQTVIENLMEVFQEYVLEMKGAA